MIKVIIGALVLIMIAGIAGHFWQPSSQEPSLISPSGQSNTQHKQVVQTHEKTFPNGEFPQIHDISEIESTDNKIKQIENIISQDEHLTKQLAEQSLQQQKVSTSKRSLINVVAAIPTDSESDAIAQKMEAKTWVALDLSQLNDLNRGDQFDLPSIDGEDYQAVVTRNKTLWNGDKSLRAKIYTNGEPYPFIMSANQQNGYLTFSTPNGTYEATLENGIGAVYSVSDIDKATENGVHPDVIDIRNM